MPIPHSKDEHISYLTIMYNIAHMDVQLFTKFTPERVLALALRMGLTHIAQAKTQRN